MAREVTYEITSGYSGWTFGVIMLGILGMAGFGTYTYSRKELSELELEKARAEKGYVIQERDLNGNGLSERFYEIDGKKSFLSIDGKNLEDSLQK